MNCVCVKSKRNCSNGVPKKNGNCQNHLEPPLRANQDDIYGEAGIQETNVARRKQDHNSHFSRPDPRRVSAAEVNYTLPPFNKMPDCNFKWNGSIDGVSFKRSIESAYREVVKWKQNIFLVP